MARDPALVLLAAALSSACFTSPGSDSAPEPPTLVGVAPQDFLGPVPCTDAAGGLRTYVTRLFDHGTAEEPMSFELPAGVVQGASGSHVPVPCTQIAVFGHVVPGHRYSAIVEAYDRTDLRALAPGESLLLDPSGNFVEPRWTTRCGRDEAGNPGTGSVISAAFVTRFVRGCEPLATSGPPTPTAITVSVTDVPDAPGCGSATGQVERFRARPAGNPAAEQEAACGEIITFSDLVGGQGYEFDLLAFEGGEVVPTWGTTCFRSALDGATVPADCIPLSTEGALEVDVDALLAAWGTTCGGPSGLSSVTATLGTESLSACGGTLRFSNLSPGPASVAVTTEQADQTPGPGALCSGTVEPGIVADATCTVLPSGP